MARKIKLDMLTGIKKMKKTRKLDDVLSDNDRMEMIWVDKGIKPVGEMKKNASEYKQVLRDRDFYVEDYKNRVFYSKNPEYVREIIHAIDSNNHEKEGALWGYPSCCREYFSRLKKQGLDPFIESVKEAKNKLKNNQLVPAYFANYAFCPACNSTRNSYSGRLEERMAEALKSEDYLLYEKFQEESNGRLVYSPAKNGDGIVLWDYSKPKDYATTKKY